jgi:hypothetical protein
MINLKKNDALADAVKEILQQEALKGNQHLIDKNKNNEVDAHDFKILRGEKKTVKEEETVEEGLKDIAKKAFKALTGGSDEDQLKALQKRAGAPVTGKKPTPQKEEVEQIDELSKSTLSSYMDKKKTEYMKGKTQSGSKENAKDIQNMGKAHDKMKKEEVQLKTLKQFKEGWDDMLADVKKRGEPQPNGGSGKKQGSAYGGSKQKDKPEQDTEKK